MTVHACAGDGRESLHVMSAVARLELRVGADVLFYALHRPGEELAAKAVNHQRQGQTNRSE